MPQSTTEKVPPISIKFKHHIKEWLREKAAKEERSINFLVNKAVARFMVSEQADGKAKQ